MSGTAYGQSPSAQTTAISTQCQLHMLRITGGKVYDPANGIDGVVKDICIDDAGRVVADVERRRVARSTPPG